jgi:hypothetical protein
MARLRLVHPADPVLCIGDVPIPAYVVSDAERAAFAEYHRARLLRPFRTKHRPQAVTQLRCTTCGDWVPEPTIGTHLRSHESQN